MGSKCFRKIEFGIKYHIHTTGTSQKKGCPKSGNFGKGCVCFRGYIHIYERGSRKKDDRKKTQKGRREAYRKKGSTQEEGRRVQARGMKKISEREFVRDYNKVYGEILYQEREKRQISREKLAYGIMSRTALEKVEKGIMRWSKAEGDILMQRMGIPADYFETVSSGEELDRWRLREDICLWVPGNRREARERIAEYRTKYRKRGTLEEQFLLKAEVILMLTEAAGSRGKHKEEAGEAALALACRAADCTIPKGWDQDGRLTKFLLAPGELEAVLLVSAALFLQGSEKAAWKLQQAVWNYPGEHQWKERLQVLILPQAAILGMRLTQTFAVKKAFDIGKEALELLRRNSCQCYVLPLLECLCGLSPEGPEDREYLRQAGKFADAFREIYRWFDCPEYRLWQGISVDNTLEVGLILKMLRKFYGKPRAGAVYDGEDLVVTERQLEKIEKGIHKLSYENYNRLAKQYGKDGGWNMPLLEMVSADVLELRQEITTLIEYRRFDEAKWKLELLREKVDTRYPRARQEMLFLDAIMKWEIEKAPEDSLRMMLEALRCTAPDFEGRDMEWWVFQREEIMLAGNIASLYRRLGQLEEAGKWFEAVNLSVEQLSRRTGVCSYGYDVLMDGYDNYLGDIKCFEEAVRMNEECARNLLKYSRISTIRNTLYRIAWNAYKSAVCKSDTSEILHQKWQNAFRLSKSMADFMFDSNLQEFLEERKEIYLP